MGPKQRKIVAFIPLRGGSKSIPLKNIKKIAGRPLAYWALDAACNCESIDNVYVSTDSKIIAETIRNYGNNKIKVISRSKETARDTSSTESAMLEFAARYDFTDIVLIQATSPLIEETHVTEGIRNYIKQKADSLVSVVRQKRFIWQKNSHGFSQPANYDPVKRPRRQDWEGYFVENGAFYITSKNNLLKHSSRLSGNIISYEMPEETFIELDELADWDIIENILLKRQSKQTESLCINKLKKIKLLVLDVDGVLTDAGMYYGKNGEELKKFNTRDGKGIELIKQQGIKVAFVTGENSQIVQKRAEKLKVDLIYLGIHNKMQIISTLVKENHIELTEIAYIGDDVNDLEVMKSVGFTATPADGNDEIKKISDYICKKSGGHGCVREICDLLVVVKQ